MAANVNARGPCALQAAAEAAAEELSSARADAEAEVSQLKGRVGYFQKLCSDTQKEVEEWRNRSEQLEARLHHHQVFGLGLWWEEGRGGAKKGGGVAESHHVANGAPVHAV